MSAFEARISKPDYKRWLKAGLCLGYLKEGLLPFISRESQYLHSDVLAYVRQQTVGSGALGPVPQCNVCTAQDIRWDNRSGKWEVWYIDPTTYHQVNYCPNHICHHYVFAIVREHILPKPRGMTWSNCNLQFWPQNHWDVSKAILDMVEDGSNKSAPNDCDCSSLLKFVEYASRCQGKISVSGATKVRRHRNVIMHSVNMELTGACLVTMANDMIALLKSLVDYNTCLPAQKAVTDIEKARDTDIEVTASDDMRMRDSRITVIARGQKRTRRDVSQISSGQKRLKAEVQTLSTHQMTLGRKVQTVSAGQMKVKRQVQQVLEEQKELKKEIHEVSTELRGEVQQMSAGQSSLKRDVEKMSVDRKKLRGEVQQMSAVQASVKKNVEKMSFDRKKLKEKVQQISAGQSSLKKDVAKLSVDRKKLGGKFQQLFAGQSSLQEDFEEISVDRKKLRGEFQQMLTGKKKLVKDVQKGFFDQKKLKKDIQGMTTGKKKLEKDVQRLSLGQNKMKEEVQEITKKVDDMSEKQKLMKEELRGQQESFDERKHQARETDFKELQKTLIELYKDKSFSEVKVSPLHEIKIPIDKIYTKLVIVEETVDMSKEGEMKHIEKKLLSYRDIFFDHRNKRRKNVAVLGSAGKGKTTFCHQLAHLWCKLHEKESCYLEQTSQGLASSEVTSKYEEESINNSRDKSESLRQFEFLLLIHLRVVKGPISIYDAVCSSLLKDYGKLHGTVKRVLEQHPEKVLVVCDGFDEYHYKDPPCRKNLHGCTVLTTTRPWKFERIRTSSDEPDVVLQLKGLEEDGVLELTEKMMLHFNEKEGKAKAKQCIQEIRNAKLEKTAQIPLILTYLVHLWYFTKDKLSQSKTVNLTKLILCILQKGKEKIKGDRNLKKSIRKWRRDLPGALHNEPDLELFGDLLLCVARLAFQGLISKNKEESLVFRGKTLNTYFSDDDKAKKVCFKFGLLSKSKISNEGRISTAVSFYHKLIQEFFSGVHAVCSEENYQELCNFCNNTENILDIGNVYTFISGLDPEKGARFSKHVADVISLDPRVTQWRKKLYYDQTDTMVQLTNLNANCLNEMEHSSCKTDHVFYTTDICVGENTPRNMKCLLHNATQTVVNMQVLFTLTKTEWKLMQQVISKSPSLQTLILVAISIGDQDVGDNVPVYDVNTNTSSHSVLQHVELHNVPAPLLPLLTRVRSTTVTQQDNSGSDSDSELTSVTKGTLRYLELEYVTMTRCEWDMLLNIVSESPSLQTLELRSISIGDQGVRDNVPVYDVNTNTSSHSALQHVELYKVPTPLLPLLIRVRSTTVTQQDNSGSGGDCAAGLTSVTIGTLTFLELVDITMTRCEWDLLVNLVSESPSLQTLILVAISIGDQDVGDNVPVYDVNTNTLSHSTLQHVELRNVHAPLFPLLTHLRSTTTVTQQDNIDGGCTAGLTSVSTGTLTHLQLSDVTMTGCEWNILVNIVSESPSLQKLDLWDITIDGNKENTDCWRQMCNTIHSSQSMTEIVLDVHKTIANMAEWRTFTSDRWSSSSGPWFYGDLMKIKLTKI